MVALVIASYIVIVGGIVLACCNAAAIGDRQNQAAYDAWGAEQ